MKRPRLVIAGGTGFLGTVLTHGLSDQYECVVLTRGRSVAAPDIKFVHWDAHTPGEWTGALEGAAALINLSGKSVDCRYTSKNKREILASRVDSTRLLGGVLQNLKQPPPVWLNAASATIYPHEEQNDRDELSAHGTGFSVNVCEQWEAACLNADTPGTRKVLLRTGMVLGQRGGPLLPLRALARFGMGGTQGKGTQFFAWLHESDFVEIVRFLLQTGTATGVYNLTAPHPVTNAELMSSLRHAMRISVGMPMPVWLLWVGAWLIRTETELVLKSRRVVPRRLLEAGYKFRYADIDSCLTDLIRVGQRLSG